MRRTIHRYASGTRDPFQYFGWNTVRFTKRSIPRYRAPFISIQIVRARVDRDALDAAAHSQLFFKNFAFLVELHNIWFTSQEIQVLRRVHRDARTAQRFGLYFRYMFVRNGIVELLDRANIGSAFFSAFFGDPYIPRGIDSHSKDRRLKSRQLGKVYPGSRELVDHVVARIYDVHVVRGGTGGVIVDRQVEQRPVGGVF